MKILVTMPAGVIRDTFIPIKTAEKLNTMGEVIWNESKDDYTTQKLREMIQEVDVCITGWGTCRFDEEVLGNANKLKLVAHTGGTVVPIVSESFFDRGIRVISGNWFFAKSVAEGVLAYILAALRDIPYYNEEVQAGRWKNENYISEGLFDQTIGLVGFGMIAKNLVELLQPFKVKIKLFSKHIDEKTLLEYNMEKASLENIFSTCKIISIHTSQRPETFHMIDAKLLKIIPKGSILVNTSRGSIIDEEAMAEELQKERFKAILDVFEEEPLPLQSKLRGHKNVILMPHMAGPTIDRRQYVTLGLMEDMGRFYMGQPLNYEISKEYAAVMTKQ